MCAEHGRRLAKQRAKVEAKKVIRADEQEKKELLKVCEKDWDEWSDGYVAIHTDWEVMRDQIVKIKDTFHDLFSVLERVERTHHLQTVGDLSKPTTVMKMMQAKIRQNEDMMDLLEAIEPISEKEEAKWHKINKKDYLPKMDFEIHNWEEKEVRNKPILGNVYQAATVNDYQQYRNRMAAA